MIRVSAVCLKAGCEGFVGIDMPCLHVHFVCIDPQDKKNGFCKRCDKVLVMPDECRFLAEQVVSQ